MPAKLPPEFSEDDHEQISTPRRGRRTASSLQTPLETYLREINETSLLSAQEEQELADRIGEGDVRARDRMVRATCDWWSTSPAATPARDSACKT